MSNNRSDWGEMVMPGVFMIQRQVRDVSYINSGSGSGRPEPVKDEDKIDYEALYMEIETIQNFIERLEHSNREIEKYLSGNNNSNSNEEEGGAPQGNTPHYDDEIEASSFDEEYHDESHSEARDDDDNNDDVGFDYEALNGARRQIAVVGSDDAITEEDREVFLDAIKENENVIANKRRELKLLLSLIKDVHSCGVHLAEDEIAPPPTAAAEPNGDAVGGGSEEVTAPSTRIVL